MLKYSTIFLSVIRGETYGYVVIPKGFSSILLQNMIMQSSQDEEDSGGNFNKNKAAGKNDDLVRVYLDQSNYVVTQTLQKAILDSTYLSIEKLMSACDLKFSFGISYARHHGLANFEKHLSFGLSMIPGVVIIIHHLLAFALTADQLVSEKEQGLLTRTYVCGLPLYLSLICQLLAHFIVIVPQVRYCNLYFSKILPRMCVRDFKNLIENAP